MKDKDLEKMRREDFANDLLEKIQSNINDLLTPYNVCPYLLPCGYCEKTGRQCFKQGATEPTVIYTNTLGK